MHWNNRIFKKKCKHSGEVYYEMHETFYIHGGDDDGELGWTIDPKIPYGSTPDELIECLEQMLSDAKKCKDNILDY